MKITALSAIALFGIGLVMHPAQKDETRQRAGRFEYCERAVTLYEDSTIGSFVIMDNFGKEGWEVFAVQATGVGDTWRNFFYMKRTAGNLGKSCVAINQDLNKNRK